MEAYKINVLTEETVGLFKDCFDANGSPKRVENIKWQFLNNPESSSFIDILFDQNKLKTAGIYAVSCVQFKIDNKIKLGAQSLDTLIDIDYRGLGLFIKMAKDVYTKAKDGGVVLIYGFPNGSSIHGFSTKLAWKVLDPVPFLIRPLNTRYFTKKISFMKWLPNVRLKWNGYKVNNKYIVKSIREIPREADEIWASFSKTFHVGVVRDRRYLNWRYMQKPGEHYEYAACYSERQECLGFVIYAVKRKHGGKIGYVMELMYYPEYQDVGKQLLKYATYQMNEARADCILAWCLQHSANYSAYKANSYLPLPEKMRPIELHFGCRSFGSNAKLIENRSNWYLSYSDSDTV